MADQYSQLEDEWKTAEETAKEDISSMVFNTFIWCQVGGAGRAACMAPSLPGQGAACMAPGLAGQDAGSQRGFGSLLTPR